MTVSIRSTGLATIGATAGLCLWLAAPAQAAPDSYSSTSTLTSVGVALIGIPVAVPIDTVSGSGGPAYRQHVSVVNGRTTVPIQGAGGLTPLQVVVSIPVGRAKVSGYFTPAPTGGKRGTDVLGAGIITSGQITLEAVGSGPLDLPLLRINIAHLRTSTELVNAVAGTKTAVGSLTLSGTLVGGKNVVVHGTLGPDTVVYAGNGISITAHETSGGTSGTTTSAGAIGLDVAFLSTPVTAGTLSGHILVETTEADVTTH